MIGNVSSIVIATAALALAVATALGAYAAHGLESILDEASITTFRISVQYHFYHGLGLFGIGLLLGRYPKSLALKSSAWLMIAGILLFCGSLYIVQFDVLTFLSVLAPFGGLCFIAAWLSLAYGAWRLRLEPSR